MKYQISIQEIVKYHNTSLYVDKLACLGYNNKQQVTKDELWIETQKWGVIYGQYAR